MFGTRLIADRIVELNGRVSTFKLMWNAGEWLLYGCNPFVLPDPAIRPYSKNYERLMDERTPTGTIVSEVLSSATGACELLRKASQSVSNDSSPSSKAAIGKVSIQANFPFNHDLHEHKQLQNEMLRNSFVMDKLRYFNLTALLFENVVSRFVDVESEGNVRLEARCKQDSSLRVCF
jgi:hypothetical protein